MSGPVPVPPEDQVPGQVADRPDVAHARDAMEASTRRWIDLALDGAEPDPDLHDVLESLLFAHMVGLVTGRRAPHTLADDLERAVRTVLETRP